MSAEVQNRPPNLVLGVLFLLSAGVLMPLCYLVIRAFDASAEEVMRLVLRPRNLGLLANTLALLAGVVTLSTCIAFPLAWLTSRTKLAGRRFWTIAGVLPLAFPSYLMAYALLAVGGNFGTAAQLFGVPVPRLSGYGGALVVLTLCNFPYLFFNLRAALLTLDPSVEEVAYSLGQNRAQVLRRVVLPQLKPAFFAGSLLIALHVLSDFGGVSLMRFETFSFALYTQYIAAMDRTYAAWLALMLLAITIAVLLAEAWFLRGLRFDRAGTAPTRPVQSRALGRWTVPAYGFMAMVIVTSVIVPVGTMLHWATLGNIGALLPDLGAALYGSVKASLPAALVATLIVIPIAFLSVRMPSRVTRLLERSAYLGYGTPSLAFALALIFFSLNLAPILYQSLFLLVFAYTMHFMAEAIGPIRSAFYQASPRVEEAARSLGASWLGAFRRVTLPLIKNGLLVSMAFVFLSCMKELHLTILLSPLGYHTLALDVWDYVDNAMFAEAAPFALTILGFSALFVGVFVMQEKQTT